MFWKNKKYYGRSRQRRKCARSDSHYRLHKEYARVLITERLEYWNSFYRLAYRRVAIKNQRSCWGSCSELGNLNFNYKIVFLPEILMDYVIVHELCHIAELSHAPAFWCWVAETIPDYRERRRHLRRMTQVPERGFPSSVFAQGIDGSREKIKAPF